MNKMFIRSRCGSYIAEAAVVLPIIILTVITVIIIIIFFYEESVNQSKMHIALRCKAGQITEKTTSYLNNENLSYFRDVREENIIVRQKILYKTLSCEKSISMVSKGVLRTLGNNTISDSFNAIDQTRFVRGVNYEKTYK